MSDTVAKSAVTRHAEHLGLHLAYTAKSEEHDRFWLSSSHNWVTTEPGKSLADISAVLDEMDGGEWSRREAEREAEQEAIRQRLAAEAAERAESEAADDPGEDDDDE